MGPHAERRAASRKAKRAKFLEQLGDGSLTIRQATAEERAARALAAPDRGPHPSKANDRPGQRAGGQQGTPTPDFNPQDGGDG
jgi:hypothetical protein